MPFRVNPYTRLKTGQIRLINDGYRDDLPFLVTVDLDQAPEFCALSYCWGTDNCLHLFTQSEGGLEKWVVTSALFEALSTLRKCGCRGLLWADMLCVNQSDNEEKQEQIPRMAEIYSRAKSVYAYLGGGQAGGIPSLSHHLRTISRFWAPIRRKDLDIIGVEYRNGLRYMITHNDLHRYSAENGVPTFDSPIWDKVLQLVSAQWWDRAWTFQESVAARSIQFLFDNELFEDEMLIWNLYTYVMGAAMQREGGKMGYPSSEMQKVVHTQRLISDNREVKLYLESESLLPRDGGGGESSNVDKKEASTHASEADNNTVAVGHSNQNECERVLESMRMLEEAVNRSSTFAQDKVYGVLGLLDSSIRNDFPVDLSHSPQKVYTHMASVLVKRSLRALSFAHTVRVTEDLPSWVPDFAAGILSLSTCATVQSAAAGSSRPQTIPRILTNDSGRIRLQGFILSTVTLCLPFRLPADAEVIPFGKSSKYGPVVLFERWVHACLRIARSRARDLSRHSWGPLPEGFLETMTFEMEGRPTVVEYCRTISKTQALLTRLACAYWGYYRSFRQGNLRLHRVLAQDTVDFVLELKVDKTFIVTSDGHIGLASGSVFTGDVVCIINEAEFPMVLRPNLLKKGEGVYRFQHDAYIHGVMNGEALKDHPPEDDIEFILE